MTIVQDDNGDLIIGGGDTVAPEQGGADPKKEGRMGILCVDLGCHNTVAAIRSSLGDNFAAAGLGGGVAVLVQNDMSKLETPTAVALRGKKKEVGEIAATQPASNAQNMVVDFLPLLGCSAEEAATLPVAPPFVITSHAETGLAAAAVEFDGQSPYVLPFEMALAWQLLAVAKYGEDQLLSLGEKERLAAAGGLPPSAWALAIVVPAGLTPRQHGALRDAALVAGFAAPVLVPQAEALAQAYAERHKGSLRAGGDDAGGAEGAERLVAIVDVGHSRTAAVLAAVSNSSARVVACESASDAGVGQINAAMMAHFSSQIEGEHGAGTCGTAKSKYRLSGAVERLKKMLSTLEETSVGVDGLIPDRDVTLKMARKDLQARNRLPSALLPACSSLSKMHEDSLTEILTRHRPMQTIAAPLCSRVSALVRRLMEQAAQEVHSVEVVGGGSRVPCVAAAVQEGAGQALSRTLDSSSALCQGASLLAALRNPDAAQHGTVPAVAAEPLPEEAGGSGMEASALVAVLAERGRVDRVQLEQALVEAEVNRLEGLISETRHKSRALMDPERSNELVDAAEEWMWGAPEDGFRLGEYKEKHDSLREELMRLNAPLFEARRAAEDKATAEMEAEAAQRRREEAEQPKEDHDNRKLKFEDRFRMAEANKAEAHELFGDGNIMHAADRYAKAMGHCQKVMGDMSPEQETRLRDLKGTLSLNLAQCFFKLERFQKSVEHCNEALRYSPDLTRATLRRGLALEQLKKWEEALADAEGVLAEDPESGPAAKLRARVQERIAAQEANARKMFQKMF